MLDIKFLRENPDVVKQNIKNKFQDRKLPLVDEVIELDKENREIKQEVQALRADRNKLSKQIGALMGQGKKEEAEEVKKQVTASADRIEAHNAGKGAKYTKARRPVELVYFETFEHKSEALKREYQIKQLKRSEKEKLILSKKKI